MSEEIFPKESWSEKAFELLKEFIRTPREFMCEDFRKFCQDKGLIQPGSQRAFGGIIRRAAFAGLIKSINYRKVTNPKAHKAFATVWQVTTIG